LREANALEIDYRAERAAAGGRPIVVVGNLPYQLAAPLLRRMAAAAPELARAIVMIQLEMAERLVASPATKEYGALTLALAARLSSRILFRVGPRAFAPPPKVQSAVLR